VIRRLFWLMAGAAAGIAGYRRAEAIARRVNRPAVARTVRETTKFVRDVRAGMDDYSARHAHETIEREGST
jgi:hypothetical protein